MDLLKTDAQHMRTLSDRLVTMIRWLSLAVDPPVVTWKRLVLCALSTMAHSLDPFGYGSLNLSITLLWVEHDLGSIIALLLNVFPRGVTQMAQQSMR